MHKCVSKIIFYLQKILKTIIVIKVFFGRGYIAQDPKFLSYVASPPHVFSIFGGHNLLSAPKN